LNDNERIAIAFLYMAGNYSFSGKMDSLAMCVQQCLSLADYINEKNKAYLYTRMGELYSEKEPEMAKKYLLKAIDIYPQLWTYLALSNIYLKEKMLKRSIIYGAKHCK
jgi:tetratricopeptide (TPR) repeat protein